MTSRKKPRFASLAKPFGCGAPRPRCPVWGHGFLEVDDRGLARVDGEPGDVAEGAA